MATKTYFGQTLINRAYIGATQHNIFSDVAPTSPLSCSALAPDAITSATLLAWYDYSSYSGSVDQTWYDKSGNGYNLSQIGTGDSAVDNAVAFYSSSYYYGSSSAIIDTIGDIRAPFSYMVFVKPQAGTQPLDNYDNAIIAAVSSSGEGQRYYPFGISKIPSGSDFAGQLEVDPPFTETTGSGFFLTSSQWEQITVNPTEVSGSEYLYNQNTLLRTLTYFPTGSGTAAIRPGLVVASNATSFGAPLFSGSIGAVMIFTGSISVDDICAIGEYYSSSYGYA